jgi:hypothetical protein
VLPTLLTMPDRTLLIVRFALLGWCLFVVASFLALAVLSYLVLNIKLLNASSKRRPPPLSAPKLMFFVIAMVMKIDPLESRLEKKVSPRSLCTQ